MKNLRCFRWLEKKAEERRPPATHLNPLNPKILKSSFRKLYLRKLFSVTSVASVAKYSSKILVSKAQICRPAGTFIRHSFYRRVKNPSLVCIVPNGTQVVDKVYQHQEGRR